MTIYINEHPNPVYIVVDGVLKMIGSGEKFNSKSPISYKDIKPVLEEPKEKKKRIRDGSKSTS